MGPISEEGVARNLAGFRRWCGRTALSRVSLWKFPHNPCSNAGSAALDGRPRSSHVLLQGGRGVRPHGSSEWHLHGPVITRIAFALCLIRLPWL